MRGARGLLAGTVAVAVLGMAFLPGSAAAGEPAPMTVGGQPAQAPVPEPGPPGATAADRAAQRAAAQTRASAEVRRTWETRGRPHRMVIIRYDRIDTVVDGALHNRVFRSGTVTLDSLRRSLPGAWLRLADGTAVLNAAIVLTTGASLTVTGDDGVRSLALQGGADTADAASIYTGGGSVTLNGVTVVSRDPATGKPLPPTAGGRPFLVASSGGRLDATDATISDLGTPTDGLDEGHPGLVFNRGSTGSVVRTTLTRNTVGMQLSGSTGVQLDQVTVADSTGDGLVLSGDQATTMGGIRATGNGGNGVLVSGARSDRPVTGVTTAANSAFGLVVMAQHGTQVSNVSTTADLSGGLRITRSTDVRVSGFTADEQPTGVYTHVGSTGIELDDVTITGGRRGVVVEKSTDGLDLRDATIEGSHVAAVAIGGKAVSLRDVRVTDARSAVRVERGATAVRLQDLRLRGGRDGVVAKAGATGVVVADLVSDGVGEDAVRSASDGIEIIGGRITGSATGIDVAAGTTVAGTTISNVGEGIHSRSPGLVRADRVAIEAVEVGANTAPGSPFQLTDSTVHALEATRGVVAKHAFNDLSLPPLNLLGAIGVPLILLAVVLEIVHSTRQLRAGTYRRRKPPVPIDAA